MQVRKILSSDTYPLRHLVLWPHIEKENRCTIDIDEREDAIHLGVFDKNQLVGICSLFRMKNAKFSSTRQYRLRAMATHPCFRNKKAGKTLVEFAIDLLRRNNVELLWCDAREVALGFYSKLGFEIIGKWYEVPQVGRHKTMYLVLKED